MGLKEVLAIEGEIKVTRIQKEKETRSLEAIAISRDWKHVFLRMNGRNTILSRSIMQRIGKLNAEFLLQNLKY